MYIDFEKLRDAGFIVAKMDDGVCIEVQGPALVERFPDLEKGLKSAGLSRMQIDTTLEEFATTVELHQVFNALK